MCIFLGLFTQKLHARIVKADFLALKDDKDAAPNTIREAVDGG